jgi:hypothetical protein
MTLTLGEAKNSKVFSICLENFRIRLRETPRNLHMYMLIYLNRYVCIYLYIYIYMEVFLENFRIRLRATSQNYKGMYTRKHIY